jgi:signal transduction histidine kinase
LQILRILQEAVTNIVKHAEADVITVKTGFTPEENGAGVIRIQVRDNGKGLGDKSDDKHSAAGYGRQSMNRRAQDLSGSVTVQSDNSGTAVMLDIPVTL